VSEPGLTLGRLIAAERNALTAINIAEQARASSADAQQKIGRLESENQALRQEINQVRLIAALKAGNGPTAGV
jgi:hypothetical protein